MFGLKVLVLLLCLAAGYGVLVLANRQERPLDKLGRFIGGVILLVSLVGLLCTAVCGFRYWRSGCFGGGAFNCPFYGGGHVLGSAPSTSSN